MKVENKMRVEKVAKEIGTSAFGVGTGLCVSQYAAKLVSSNPLVQVGLSVVSGIAGKKLADTTIDIIQNRSYESFIDDLEDDDEECESEAVEPVVYTTVDTETLSEGTPSEEKSEANK